MTATRILRPANRRELILAAAGRAFSARGYHAVAMEDIAASVGITAPALYRHFPNKYAIFRACAQRLADALAVALDDVPENADLTFLFGEVARITVADRATGGLYRWEGRYLEQADRRRLRETFTRIVARVAGAITDSRADGQRLTAEQQRVLASSALGAIGSVTTHRTSTGPRAMEVLLADAARRVASAPMPPLPSAHQHTGPDHSKRHDTVDRVNPGRQRRTQRRQQILDAAVPLFHRDGYADVSMGAIAGEVGLTTSGLYRHFAGKADILAAACLRAAEVLRAAVAQAVADADGSPDRMAALATAYVAYSFEHTALTSVATAESGGLPAALQRPILAAQRDHVTLWQDLLREARPDLGPKEARLLVHAALGVVTEAGRALHWADSPENRDQVLAFVLAALGIDEDRGVQFSTGGGLH